VSNRHKGTPAVQEKKSLRVKEDPEILAVGSCDNWKEIRMTIDSGACDHVVNPRTVRGRAVDTKTEAVRNAVTYYTASGHPLPNLGEVRLCGSTAEGLGLNMTMQVADVKKTLASVRKMCEAGNRVVFEDGPDGSGGYVENKAWNGQRVPILKDAGTYQVVMHVQDESRHEIQELIAGLSEDEADDEDVEVEPTRDLSLGFIRHP